MSSSSESLPVFGPYAAETLLDLGLIDNANTDNFDVAICLTGKGQDSPVIVYAHSTILRSRAHGFWSRMHVTGIGTTRPIRIHLQDVDATALCRLLRFVYGGGLPDFDNMSRREMIDLLVVAERFTCNNKFCTSKCACKEMKLIAETKITSLGFSIDNVCDFLRLAHAMKCSKLKSAAVEYLVQNYESVSKTDRYRRLMRANAKSPGIADDIIRAAIQYAPNREKKRPNSSNPGNKGQRQDGKKRQRRKALGRVQTVVQQEIDEVEDLARKAKLMTDELRSVKKDLDLIKYERR